VLKKYPKELPVTNNIKEKYGFFHIRRAKDMDQSAKVKVIGFERPEAVEITRL
jgi:hypothetical protein